MTKTCIKCGHTAPAPTEPLAACPQCGIIYARAEAAARSREMLEQRAARMQAQQDAPSHPKPGGRRLNLVAIFERITWAAAMVMALLGFIELLMISNDEFAPQQAVRAAAAIGMAVIPYCFARCVHEIRHWKR